MVLRGASCRFWEWIFGTKFEVSNERRMFQNLLRDHRDGGS